MEGMKEGENKEEREKGGEGDEEGRRNRPDLAPVTQNSKTPNTISEPRPVGCLHCSQLTITMA